MNLQSDCLRSCLSVCPMYAYSLKNILIGCMHCKRNQFGCHHHGCSTSVMT